MLTDNEIKKALECCILGDCFSCYYGKTDQWHCRDDLMQNALDLINHLQAENERLTIRLRKAEHQLDDAMKMYNIIKAEAYKEFAEKLKEKLVYEHFFETEVVFLDKIEIDNLYKELVGDENV